MNTEEMIEENNEYPKYKTLEGDNKSHTVMGTMTRGLSLVREFETGATRDLDISKIDYEACLSPIVLEAFGEYMLSCSVQADGSKRPGDNWQLGITFNSYIKSLLRHVWDLWKLHRGYPTIDKKTGKPVNKETALCAIIFNAQGYLHELLKEKLKNGVC
jgi:hypothetical protein